VGQPLDLAASVDHHVRVDHGRVVAGVRATLEVEIGFFTNCSYINVLHRAPRGQIQKQSHSYTYA
jgi:hypothetical protein